MWYRGHVDIDSLEPVWRTLPYHRQPLTDEENARWRAVGYTQEHFTGEMYDSRNPMPEWVNRVADEIGLTNCGFVFYRMTTGVVMPTHVDQFTRYCQVFQVERSTVWRAIVFLEDWSPGHYFEIDGEPVMSYRRGDYILWSCDTPHAASNIGLDTRYTLQITGTDSQLLKTADHGHELQWANIPDLADNLSFLDYKIRNETHLGTSSHAYLIWTGTGSIPALETMRLSTQQISLLPDHQLTIYLYEPITLLTDGIAANRLYYHEFRYPWQPDGWYSPELDSILRFSAAHEHAFDIKVMLGDLCVEMLQQRYEPLHLATHDIWLRLASTRYFPRITAVPTRRFWCGNWRWTAHRHLLMSYLSHNDGVYSWHLSCDWEVLCQNGWIDLDEHTLGKDRLRRLRAGSDMISNQSYEIDHRDISARVEHIYDFAMPGQKPMDQTSSTFWQSYLDAFVAIVTETRFAAPFANFSEKALAPMMMMRPFVIAAPPFTLAYLHDLGFKTFDAWWDESYDNMIDPSRRLMAIFDLIDHIASLDEATCLGMLQDMDDVLRFNQDLVVRLGMDNRVSHASEAMLRELLP